LYDNRQIKLFHQDDKTDLPVDPPDVKAYFRLIERGDKKLPDLYILGTIKCGPELVGLPVPTDYNAAVMRVKRQVAEEARHCQPTSSVRISCFHMGMSFANI